MKDIERDSIYKGMALQLKRNEQDNTVGMKRSSMVLPSLPSEEPLPEEVEEPPLPSRDYQDNNKDKEHPTSYKPSINISVDEFSSLQLQLLDTADHIKRRSIEVTNNILKPSSPPLPV